MARLSTIYDKIYDEESGKYLSCKVFRLRGDEAYARTTDVEVTYTTPNESEIDGFTTDITVNLFRTIGSSTLTLFDSDENTILAHWDVTESVTSKTISGVKLSYGYDHNLYAVYDGNSQCLSSKSKTNTLHVDIPSTFVTEIDTTGTSTEVSTGGIVSVKATLTMNGETPSSVFNRDIIISVDDEYANTITTGTEESGENFAETTLSGMSNGSHTITFEVESASNINYAIATVTVEVGHELTITSCPSVVATDHYGEYEPYPILTGTVKTGSGIPVTDKITLTSYDTNGNQYWSTTRSSNSKGIVSFDLWGDLDITTGTLQLSYEGSTSDVKSITVNTISKSTLSSSQYLYYNKSNTITSTINTSSSSDVGGLITKVYDEYNSKLIGSATTDSNGIASIKYNGEGIGLMSLFNSLSTNEYNVRDVYQHWTPSQKVNDFCNMMFGNITEYNSYYTLSADESVNNWIVDISPVNGNTNIYFHFKLAKDYASHLTLSLDSYYSDTTSIGWEMAFKKDDIISFSMEGNLAKIYVNGEMKTSRTLYPSQYHDTINIQGFLLMAEQEFSFSEFVYSKFNEGDEPYWNSLGM